MRAIAFLLLLSTLLWSCEENVFTPKPRGFPKVEYPEKNYQSFHQNFCDFTFDYPTYARIQRDTAFFDEKPAHPCWFDLVIPAFNCRLYCSYLPINKNHPAEKLINDAFKMTDWHNKKATYIEEKPFWKANDVKGMLFELEGPVASSLQFFLTDSLEQRHFFRAALYFNTEARPDSLAPIYTFVKKDIQRILETFEWNP